MSNTANHRTLQRFATGLLVIGSAFMLGACDDILGGRAHNAAAATSGATANTADSGPAASATPSTSPNTSPTTTPSTAPTNGITPSAAPTNASGNATVTWVPPQQNADGTMLTDLAGFRIYYGTSADELTQAVDISTNGTTSFRIANLPNGTWYFAVAALNAAGIEGDLSNVASKTIS
jgi:hypothetical protein